MLKERRTPPSTGAARLPVVVVGAGIGGLASALALGRAGRPVLLLERDPLEEAVGNGADRRGVPQGRHTHGLLARLSEELRHRFPDVLDELRAAGAAELVLPGVSGDYRVVLARRATLEAALRRAVMAEPGVTLRCDSPVTGLVAAGDPGAAVPTVGGVRLADGTVLPAEAVVAAGGRRSDLAGWLEPLGVALHEERSDHGMVYLTRWYRFDRPGEQPLEPRFFGDTGFLKYLAVPADGGVMSVSACLAADDELRPLLSRPDGFDRAVRALPDPIGFLDTHLGEPLGPVHPMGGLVNRLRRFTDDGGEPVVLGMHAVGDAHTCTNPIHGRGCSVALVQAGLLADAFGAHPADARGRAAAYEAANQVQIEPWYRLSVMVDQPRRTMAPEMRQAAASLETLFAAVIGGQVDEPVLVDACSRVVNMLTTPDALFAEPEVMARAAAVMADSELLGRLGAMTSGPSREDLLAAVAA